MSALDNYNQIVSAKQAESGLNGLTSTSRYSVWRSLAYAVAFAWENVRLSLNALRLDVILTAQRASTANSAWIVDRAKEFRWNAAGGPSGTGYAYALDPSSKKVEYIDGDNDPNALIVTFAAIDESGPVPILIVATGPIGARVPLEASQLNAFEQYTADRLRPWPGRLGVASRAADRVQVEGILEYYANQGDQQSVAQTAIEDYINNLPSTGKINRNDLEQAVRALEGVKDFQISLLQFRAASAVSWQNVGNEAQLYACYATLDNVVFTLKEAAYL
jgi:hypothetical protein